ncbi:cytochrome C oxidase subunit II [Natronolimnobius sp. AArcel1]|uniref:cytochrome c oxidase subunit II n=1 Tax=Natronolimnobius sp. AArcel1 TaxID=1679093 RepID=UPI0013EAABAC|nr:cytochrome c oxidase subunit II [Natronolimnobius sp. AArcel1]NGM68210.1 cytochrome C oxidase subunit II [Natronolimnobius sp. AArcel1]
MNIHSYEKLWLAAAMLLIVGFIATITYGSVGLGITMVGDQEPTVEPDALNEDERFGEPRVEQVGENEYEAYVIAQMFTFQPETIEVPEDSEVTFYVTSRDVIHSFSVAGTNINTMAIPGEVAEMTVEFDDPQEYGVVCNEYCGPDHHNMEGQLHVVPEDDFDLTELSVDAPNEVDAGEDATIDVALENRMHDTLETTVTLEAGDETFTEDVTVDGEDTTETTFTLEESLLEADDTDWTVTVDDYEESGTVTVVDDSADDDDAADDEDAADSADADDEDADGGDDDE